MHSLLNERTEQLVLPEPKGGGISGYDGGQHFYGTMSTRLSGAPGVSIISAITQQ